MKPNYTQSLIFFIISSIAFPAYSTDDSKAMNNGDHFFEWTKTNKWKDEIHISRSHTQGADYSKAATLAYTNDGRTTAYYNIDGSIGYTLGEFPNNGSPIKISGFIEEHKNSVTSKRQDVVSGGLSFDGKYGHLTDIQWLPKFTINAIDDRGLDYTGWASLFALSGISRPWKMNYQELNTSGIQWNWSPQIGTQVSRSNSTHTGSATRLFVLADVTLAPLFPWEIDGPDRQLSFTLSHKTIFQNYESGILNTQQKNHHVDSISANWSLSPSSKNNPVTLSLSRTIGSDPMESLPNIGLTKLSINFKI